MLILDNPNHFAKVWNGIKCKMPSHLWQRSFWSTYVVVVVVDVAVVVAVVVGGVNEDIANIVVVSIDVVTIVVAVAVAIVVVVLKTGSSFDSNAN